MKLQINISPHVIRNAHGAICKLLLLKYSEHFDFKCSPELVRADCIFNI